MGGSAWELKFDAERGLLGGFGGLVGCILRVWKALGGSKCRTARVWKLKTSINTSHLFDFSVFYVSGRFWEAQCVVFYLPRRLWEAKCVVFYVSGSSKRRKIQHICLAFGRPGRLSPIPIRGKLSVPGAHLST